MTTTDGSADPGAAVLHTYPGLAAMAAFERYAVDPAAADEVRAAVARIAEMAGAAGAWIRVDAPPMPPFEAGVGTLAGGTADEGGEDGSDIQAASAGRRLGRIVVDAPPEARLAVAGALERAVEATWTKLEARASRDRLAALDAATRAIVAELDVDRVLQLIVDRVRELIGARYAALGIEDGHGRIERFITAGITAEERAAIGPPPVGHGLLGYIIREGRSLLIPDIAEHPDRSGFPANHPHMSSLLGVPVILDGRPIGDLYLTDKEGGHGFTDDDRVIVEQFATHAGIAIDNARLHERVGRLAVVDERARIGRDLHDGIIQSIYAVGLSLEQALGAVRDDPADAEERVDRAIDGLNLVIADLREYILGLRPQLSRDDDVVASLARAAEELRLNTTTDLEIDLEGGADHLRQLPPDRAAALLSIARESLSNIVRHAAAAKASLALRGASGQVRLEVADDGRGFDTTAPVVPDELGRHQGLANMRDRAVAAGGTFHLVSAPGKGTRIIVTMPVPLPDPSMETA